MVRHCPKCDSLLVARYGESSPIDGWCDYVCLNCGTELQPHRIRPILYAYGLLAALAIPFMIATAIWVIAHQFYGVLFGLLAVVIGSAQTLRYVFRTARKPVTKKFDTSHYPKDGVRLTHLEIVAVGAIVVEEEWVRSLSEFVAKVSSLAASSLKADSARYKASARMTLSPHGREVVLGYRGRPDTECLNVMFAALERIPALALPKGRLEIVFWYSVAP